jgi:urease accessory protein
VNQSANIDAQQPCAKNWFASLAMTFAKKANKTALVDSARFGPLGVQRTFYPDKTGCAHVYVLHPPAGIVSGDTLVLSADAKTKAKVLITTPGAARFYRARIADAASSLQTQKVELTVENEASLEYLPMETLVYNKANALNKTTINIEGSGQYIGWEITCLGLPHIDQAFDQGCLTQSITLFHNKKCVFHDNMAISKYDDIDNALMDQRVALGGHHVVGNMIMYDGAANLKQEQLGLDTSFTAHLIALCREAISSFEEALEADVLIAVTELQNVIIIRYLGCSSEQCRNVFADIWKAVRPVMLNMQGIAPRIWHT